MLLAATFSIAALAVGAGEARAAAPPTGSAELSIAAAPAGTVAGSVAAGAQHGCGVKTDGSLACWGANGSSQATPPSGTFTAVSAGLFHSCGVKTDGSLACWGNNGSGRASPPTGTFSAVSVGDAHSCGVKTSGSLACWGDINTAPVADDDSYRVGKKAKTLTVPASGGVLANDSDPEDDPLTARLISGPSKGKLTLNADGSFTYKKPKKGFRGVTFVYEASDGKGGTDTATVSIR